MAHASRLLVLKGCCCCCRRSPSFPCCLSARDQAILCVHAKGAPIASRCCLLCARVCESRCSHRVCAFASASLSVTGRLVAAKNRTKSRHHHPLFLSLPHLSSTSLFQSNASFFAEGASRILIFRLSFSLSLSLPLLPHAPLFSPSLALPFKGKEIRRRERERGKFASLRRSCSSPLLLLRLLCCNNRSRVSFFPACVCECVSE